MAATNRHELAPLTARSRTKSAAAASIVALATALLAGGCDRSEAPAPPAKNPPAPTAAPRDASTKVVDIAWPPEASIDRAARAALAPESAAAIPQSPVPVLVPRDPALLARGVLMAEPNWYSFTTDAVDAQGAKYHVVVSASRVTHQHADIPPARGPVRLRGTDAFVTRNEGIPSATWVEHGVAYALDVECSSPTHARCTGDDLLKSVVESLVYIGGAGERGSAP